jgi:CHAT domain-containing protein
LKEALPRPGAGKNDVDLAYKEERGIGSLQAEAFAGVPSASLNELIWRPLDSLLGGVKTIYFTPSGQLHGVSMAAIPCPDSTLLMDRYNLVQLSSTRTLATPQEELNIRDAAVYGGIQYDLDTLKLMAEAGKYEKPGNDLIAFESTPRGGTRNAFQYLEGTKKEANIVSGKFELDGIPVKVYSGINAPEESFAAFSGPNSPSVIHIATHGFYLPDTLSNKENRELMMISAIGQERFRLADDPLLRSGLVMAGGNLAWRGEQIPAGLEDGILTAKEVTNMNLLNTQLVVLSACQTGLGDVKGSEGVEGLMRGFKMAGVRFIMMSLWEVPDAETVEFMQHFYDNWLGGQEIRTAFQNSQKQMRAKYPEEPYKWAAFVLVE